MDIKKIMVDIVDVIPQLTEDQLKYLRNACNRELQHRKTIEHHYNPKKPHRERRFIFKDLNLAKEFYRSYEEYGESRTIKEPACRLITIPLINAESRKGKYWVLLCSNADVLKDIKEHYILTNDYFVYSNGKRRRNNDTYIVEAKDENEHGGC